MRQTRKVSKAAATELSRRRFIKGSGAAGIGALGLGFAPGVSAGANKTLVSVFLRGGLDGLSLVPPIGGVDYGHYVDAREATRIDINNSDLADRPIPLSGLFGLHPFGNPAAVPNNLDNGNVATHGLSQLWSGGKLAILHACGHVEESTRTRSHFDAQEQIDLGTPGAQNAIDGWLARYLQPAINPNIRSDAVFTAMVSGSNPPSSLNGWSDTVTLDSTGSFHPNYKDRNYYDETLLVSLARMYGGTGSMDSAVQAALGSVELVQSQLMGDYTPAGGVVYPEGGTGSDFALAARLIKQDLGLATVAIDIGGWDTHTEQNVLNSFNNYGDRIWRLSAAIGALYYDLAASGRANDVAIVVQSEFGRQISENANRGTDHGLGNPMLVVGGGVTGGLYGSWPGIARAQRDSDSLEPTTDFRDVQATIMRDLMGLAGSDAEGVFRSVDSSYGANYLNFA